jgi:pyridoxamine 5'-phosphate oxidase
VQPLEAKNIPPDPITLFEAWFDEAVKAGNVLPNAMALATCAPDGHPSVRYVLLKQCDSRGFVFFSNYESRKGREMEGNRHVAAAIFWAEPRRQVRIEGVVRRVPEAESDAYFATRDRGSQVGAWASPQSQPISGPSQLRQEIQELEERFSGQSVPRPENWGGYVIIPERIEFWIEGENRLHDRILYSLGEDGAWTTERLAP